MSSKYSSITELDKCINTTYETLIKEYKKISEKEESINEEHSQKEEDLPDYEGMFEIEDKIYFITAILKFYIRKKKKIFH